MALFKVFRGQRNDLDSVTKVDGHAYFCTDDGSFWIDYLDGEEVKRKQVNDEDLHKLNIKNGEGICSLVQNYTSELDPNPENYANKATGALAIALGEGSEASGPIAIAAGAAVKSTAICATSFGQNIENNAPAGFVTGQNNQTSSSATNAFVANQGNRAEHLNSTVFGFHNNSTSENELVLGRYAYNGLHIIPEDAPFDQSATNTLLRVGYAFSDGDRSNLLELTDKYLALRGGIYSKGEIRAKSLSGVNAKIDVNLTALNVNSNIIYTDELHPLTTNGLNIKGVKDLTTDYIKVLTNAQFENAPWIMAEPTNNYHAVNKIYVDNAVKNVQDTLVYATVTDILALWEA